MRFACNGRSVIDLLVTLLFLAVLIMAAITVLQICRTESAQRLDKPSSMQPNFDLEAFHAFRIANTRPNERWPYRESDRRFG